MMTRKMLTWLCFGLQPMRNPANWVLAPASLISITTDALSFLLLMAARWEAQLFSIIWATENLKTLLERQELILHGMELPAPQAIMTMTAIPTWLSARRSKS